MVKKGKRISGSTLQAEGKNYPVADNATSTGFPLDNVHLQAKYDEMHKQGSSSWFSDGREERETILKMGEPWKDLEVLEIGCGEGHLTYQINRNQNGHGMCYGIDYSEVAIKKALEIYGGVFIYEQKSYKDVTKKYDRLVMQGVLEHLDDPFGELQWMIEHFKPKTVITSSPCFLNPRGIVWMTLDMLGAVMSKTDIHYLDPTEFKAFCKIHGYRLRMQDCDWEWGNGHLMIDDFRNRIPLAIKDGNLPQPKDFDRFLEWLYYDEIPSGRGATMVYRIDI